MVICLLARRIWTHGLGGMEEHCRSVATELVRLGHPVHVLTTAHPEGRLTEQAYGATLHYLPTTPPGDYSGAWWRESRRWAREHFPRLGVGAVLSMSMAAYGLVGLAGPPLYTIIHGWGLNQLRSYWHDAHGWRRLAEFPRSALALVAALPKARRLARASACVLAVSREIERQLERYRVCFVPNWIDASAFPADPAERARVRAGLGLGADDCVALMVSTLSRQKGVHIGLRACAVLARECPSLAAVVVGDGAAAAELKAETRRDAPHLRAHFAGARPHAEVPAYYAAADLFLLPTLRQEGMPTTVLEAMAAGLPVVGTRAGGTPTGVADGTTGLLVGLGDVRAFTDAVRALVSDPGLRRRMGQAGRARVLSEFDRSVVVPRLVRVLGAGSC